MTEIDKNVLNIAASPVNSIDDVIAVFEAIENALPESDGLRWFNWLYLTVTKSVGASVAAHHWNNPAWLARLDVVFASLYLAALRQGLSASPTAPRCWQVMLNARHDARLARIQFATAGMNAHIDHDLCVAVVTTCQEMGLTPIHGSPLYADYTQVNQLLESLIDTAKQQLRIGLPGNVIPDLGKLEDRLAGFGIVAAREAAWTNAELLWHIQALPGLGARFASGLDRAAALAGLGLLAPLV
ncbi:MAG TPA: DUF5995 family protein [Bryobacteraceae bacterium]|nr:DUF5995 family protein [Bryobacteraceae bacterium]